MPSPLEEYSMNYGANLRAALNGTSALVEDPNARGGPGGMNGRPSFGDSPLQRLPQNPDEQTGEGADTTLDTDNFDFGSADPDGGNMSGRRGDATSALADQQGRQGSGPQGGYTFRDMWKDAPEKVKKEQMDKLEQSLKQGNQTIDSAYDDLEKQLGTPPAKEKSLTKQEKGMLLMEFGLNVLANNKKGFGAIGGAGGYALHHATQMREQPYKDYKATVGAIEGARAKSKAHFAEESAIAGMKAHTNPGKLPGRFTGDDGNVYFYDEQGQVQPALDGNGKPIKAAERDRIGEGGKTFESDSKYNRYMEIYGIDQATGKPLTGLALQKVKQDALDFANDRGKTLDDLDLDLQAEKSADQWMHDHADLFEGMNESQLEAKRNEIASARRQRLQRKVRSPLENIPPNEPHRGNPNGVKKRFATEADAKAAFDRGDIQVGDTIIVNGVEGPVE